MCACLCFLQTCTQFTVKRICLVLVAPGLESELPMLCNAVTRRLLRIGHLPHRVCSRMCRSHAAREGDGMIHMEEEPFI